MSAPAQSAEQVTDNTYYGGYRGQDPDGAYDHRQSKVEYPESAFQGVIQVVDIVLLLLLYVREVLYLTLGLIARQFTRPDFNGAC